MLVPVIQKNLSIEAYEVEFFLDEISSEALGTLVDNLDSIHTTNDLQELVTNNPREK